MVLMWRSGFVKKMMWGEGWMMVRGCEDDDESVEVMIC